MIVGIQGNSILECTIELEANHIKIFLRKGTIKKIEDFIKNFNSIEWEEKTNSILKEDDVDEETIRLKIKDYVEKETDLSSITTDDFVFDDESIDNVKNYNGEHINVIDNMKYFTNRILPTQVIDMLNDFNNNIEDISNKDVAITSMLSGMSDFVLYMGPNQKYRGCIGKHVKTRDDEASLLIEFPNKYRDSGKIARFWSKPSNLVNFSRES